MTSLFPPGKAAIYPRLPRTLNSCIQTNSIEFDMALAWRKLSRTLHSAKESVCRRQEADLVEVFKRYQEVSTLLGLGYVGCLRQGLAGAVCLQPDLKKAVLRALPAGHEPAPAAFRWCRAAQCRRRPTTTSAPAAVAATRTCSALPVSVAAAYLAAPGHAC